MQGPTPASARAFIDKTAARIRVLQEGFAELAAGLDIFGIEKMDSSEITATERVSFLYAFTCFKSQGKENPAKHRSMLGVAIKTQGNTAVEWNTKAGRGLAGLAADVCRVIQIFPDADGRNNPAVKNSC